MRTKRFAYPAVMLAAVMMAANPHAGAVEEVSFTESTARLLPGDVTSPFFSGVAMGVVDVDGDGKDDIVRFERGEDLRIEYQRAPGGPFSTVAGPSFDTIRVAVAAADYDGNGVCDFVCGGYEGGAHLLTSNPSGTEFATTALPDPDIVMQGMNFVDLDDDGDVDVFACDDVDDNHKYRNDGSGGFVLAPSLIDTFLADQPGQVNPNAGNYASLWTDYDNDGDLDMYLSKCWARENDPTQLSRINRLFRNNGDRSFSDVAAEAGLDSGAQTWCADFADIDNDGDLDVFMVNHVVGPEDTPSALYLNNGDGTFAEKTESAGIDIAYFGIQTLFRDLNNDGFVDLLISTANIGYRVYLNEGDGTFTRRTEVFTTERTGTGEDLGHIQSFAIGDLNGDGWLDLYAGRARGFNSPSTRPDRVFLNDGGANHYFQVHLEGTDSNPDGIGARLELHGEWGIQIREVRSGEGYGITNSFAKHFGLGSATAIDRLVVRWPSGTVDVVYNPAIDRVLTLEEGASPDTFENWQHGFFSEEELLEPETSGPSGNPDRDELQNLFEWYFQSNPRSAASTKREIARLSLEELAPGDQRLVLTVDRNRKAGVMETAEVSSNLVTWMPDEAQVELIDDTADQLVFRSTKGTGELGFQAIRFRIELLE